MNPILLTEKYLEETIKMVNSVFPNDVDARYNPRRSYSTYIKFKNNPELMDSSPMRKLDYWIVLNDADKVIGVTGLYNRKEDSEDLVWLGWYCVSPSERGKGIGRKLLEWTIEEVKKEGFKKLKLYTSTDPNEALAQKLYDELDFKITAEEITPGEYMTLYREKIL